MFFLYGKHSVLQIVFVHEQVDVTGYSQLELAIVSSAMRCSIAALSAPSVK